MVDLIRWQQCLAQLQAELPAKQFNTWIRPLQAETTNQTLRLFAPNSFVLEYVKTNFISKIIALLQNLGELTPNIQLAVGSLTSHSPSVTVSQPNATQRVAETLLPNKYSLNRGFTFANFIEGKANQLARAAALHVAQNPGQAYNPLFIYGGAGLGKTHLMHAIGNALAEHNPATKILYLHSERFVAEMVRALQHNKIADFKNSYRSADALLIDDIQFLAGKERSQEEFFHTFNSLLEAEQQIILSCDRYPKELAGLEERLKSRFGWGLTVAIEPPELEMRAAILLKKAELLEVPLSAEIAFFIARYIQSNVRELEGALKRVIANAAFTGKAITLEFVREVLKDLFSLHSKSVTISSIQKIVADYFKIKLTDLLSKQRVRVIARPRQLAMALAKELTTHSLAEIAQAFGGRDHTTVLHACRTIKELMIVDAEVAEDYRNLMRILAS